MAKTSKISLKKAVKWLNLKICFFCSKYRLLSSVYYFLFCSKMSREHQAVINGKIAHLNKIKNNDNNEFLLRRNIHRLEKGLIMRPLKEVFAESYIGETLSAYEVAIKLKGSTESESLIWARDVLERYFSVVDIRKNAVVQSSFNKFQQCKLNSYDASLKKTPFKRDLEGPCVSFDEFYALCNRRRSVRWFEDRKVPEELLDRAIMAAIQAPSACNRQPFKFRIYNERDKVDELAKLPMGTKGFSHNFPCIIAVTGDLSAFFDERDRHIIYIDSSLAVMGLILALETFGLSSCVINWPDIEKKERKISDLIGLRPEERVIMLLAVGWPEKMAEVPFSQKKSLDEVRSYN